MKELKIKQIIEVLYVFLRKNVSWVWGLLTLVGVGVFLASRGARSKDEFVQSLQILNQKRKKDYRELAEQYEGEVEKRREVIETLSDALNEIEQRYTEKRRDAEGNIKDEVTEKAKEYEKDPESFVEEVANKYGLEVK